MLKKFKDNDIRVHIHLNKNVRIDSVIEAKEQDWFFLSHPHYFILYDILLMGGFYIVLYIYTWLFRVKLCFLLLWFLSALLQKVGKNSQMQSKRNWSLNLIEDLYSRTDVRKKYGLVDLESLFLQELAGKWLQDQNKHW